MISLMVTTMPSSLEWLAQNESVCTISCFSHFPKILELISSELFLPHVLKKITGLIALQVFSVLVVITRNSLKRTKNYLSKTKLFFLEDVAKSPFTRSDTTWASDIALIFHVAWMALVCSFFILLLPCFRSSFTFRLSPFITLHSYCTSFFLFFTSV